MITLIGPCFSVIVIVTFVFFCSPHKAGEFIATLQVANCLVIKFPSVANNPKSIIAIRRELDRQIRGLAHKPSAAARAWLDEVAPLKKADAS